MAITVPQTIPTMPTAPDPSDRPTFNSRSYAWTAAVPGMISAQNQSNDATYQNALEAQTYALSAVNAPGTQASSTSSLTVGTGTKSLTIQTGKSFIATQFVLVAKTSAPTNYMVGQITSYDSGTGALVVEVSNSSGTGTHTDWTVTNLPAPIDVPDFPAEIHAAMAKGTPATNDEFGFADSGASWVLKKITWGQILGNLGTTFLNLAGGAVTGITTFAEKIQLNLGALTNGRYLSGKSDGSLSVLSNASVEQSVFPAAGGFQSVSGTIGYGAGAGGAVTQATDKTTAVTLNACSGRVTMHNAALAAGATVLFRLNNNKIAATDLVIINGFYSTVDPLNYRIEPAYVTAAGGFVDIRVTNISGISRSEALQFNFAVIKGSIT